MLIITRPQNKKLKTTFEKELLAILQFLTDFGKGCINVWSAVSDFFEAISEIPQKSKKSFIQACEIVAESNLAFMDTVTAEHRDRSGGYGYYHRNGIYYGFFQ